MRIQFSNYNPYGPKNVFIYDSGEDSGKPPTITIVNNVSLTESSVFKFSLPVTPALRGNISDKLQDAAVLALQGQFGQAADLFSSIITDTDADTNIVRKGVSNKESLFLRVPRTTGIYVDIYLTSNRK